MAHVPPYIYIYIYRTSSNLYTPDSVSLASLARQICPCVAKAIIDLYFVTVADMVKTIAVERKVLSGNVTHFASLLKNWDAACPHRIFLLVIVSVRLF